MQVNRLKTGDIYRNYGHLCEILEIKPTKKANNQRNAQFKELERYVKWHREGHKIIIDEVYSDVKDKVDGRTKGNNNELSKNLRYMILHLCSKNKLRDKEEIGFSKIFLYNYCGMINDNYKDSKGNRQAFAEYLNLDQIAIDEALEYTDNRLGQAFRRALSVLTNTNKALGHRYGYNFILSTVKNHITADIELENVIRDVENKVMKEMRISRYDRIYAVGRWNEFKKKVIGILKSEYPLYFKNLKYYYNAIVLNYKDETIRRTLEGFQNDFGLTVKVAKGNVNKVFSKSLDGTIVRRHNKYVGVESDDKFEMYRGSSNYICEQKVTKNTIVKDNVKRVYFKPVEDTDCDYEQLSLI